VPPSGRAVPGPPVCFLSPQFRYTHSFVRHFFYPVPFLLLAAACSRTPDIYQPPIQRKPMTGPDAHVGQFVNMSDLAADAFVVRDISKTTEGGSWRWAYRHPELRYYVRRIESLHFVMDLGIPEHTFRETGPVTLTISINGHELDKIRFDQPGDRHFDKPVPEPFMQRGAENFVSFETDKQWVSKEDGAVLSFVLSRAGFIKK
jgi:hypothetical protein